MAIYELADISEFIGLAMDTQGRLDANWAFFLSINSAIIGGVVLIERTFNIMEKSVVIVVYTMLSILSFFVSKSSIKQLYALYSDIIKIEYTPEQAGHDIVEHFSNIVNSSSLASTWLIPMIYIAAYIVTVLCVIFDEKFTFTKKI